MQGMSSGEIERRVIEGRVFTDGVAQETTREGDVTRVKLTCMPGHTAGTAMAHGGPGTIAFPEPVAVGAGETLVIEVEGLPDGGGSERLHISNPAVITSAYVAPSLPPLP